MNEDRRFILSILVAFRAVHVAECFIDFANQTEQDIGAFGNIEIGPADTLDLYDLSRLGLRMVVVRDLEYSFNVRDGSFFGLGCRSGHAEVESGIGSLGLVVAPSLRDLGHVQGTVLFGFPVISAFN
jgi:hypothetical protein